MHQEIAADPSTNLAQKFEEECQCLSKLYHPNIVYFVGLYFKRAETFPSLLMELLPMSLDSALTKYQNMLTYMKYIILRDVACGLSYLHGQREPVVHRDLTSRNVLLTDSFRAKIADFGVARIVPREQLGQVLKLTKVPGNALFMPPESFSEDPVYDVSQDMFSYGVLILNTVNQKRPKVKYPKANERSILDEVERRREDLDAMGKDHPLIQFTEQCLRDYCVRPTALQAVEELTMAVHSSPAQYPNSLAMLQDIDKLRGKTNQLLSNIQSLESTGKDLTIEKEALVQQNSAIGARLQHQADEIRLTKRLLDSKTNEVVRVNDEKLVTEQLLCQKNSRIVTLEMEISALKRMPKNKVRFVQYCSHGYNHKHSCVCFFLCLCRHWLVCVGHSRRAIGQLCDV